MKNINGILNQLTDVRTMFRQVQDALRMIDPAYPQEERQYLAACDILEREIGSSVTPGAGVYISAMEQRFVSDILYVAWQGFMLNLNIFQNPVNALLLREDFEDLHQERRMHILPAAGEAQKIINSFYQNIPQEQRYLTDAIDDYYAYLQTVGYKLAHYIGFLFGNRFLPKVVPGYAADEVSTDRYTRVLREFLQMNVDKIRTLI